MLGQVDPVRQLPALQFERPVRLVGRLAWMAASVYRDALAIACGSDWGNT
jgi:hypothetical protein